MKHTINSYLDKCLMNFDSGTNFDKLVQLGLQSSYFIPLGYQSLCNGYINNVRVSLISPGFIKTPLTDKNEFPMPFIKSPEFAAEKMFKGLTKSKSFETHFPKELTLFLKFLRILPYRIYLFMIDKFVKR